MLFIAFSFLDLSLDIPAHFASKSSKGENRCHLSGECCKLRIVRTKTLTFPKYFDSKYHGCLYQFENKSKYIANLNAAIPHDCPL